MIRRYSADRSANTCRLIAIVVTALAVTAACWADAGEGLASTKAPAAKPVMALKVKASNGALTLSWRSPRNAKAAKVIGYRIEYRKAGKRSWTLAKLVSQRKTTFRLNGLTNGVAYELRISAKCAGGTGASKVIKGIPRERGVGGLGTDPPTLIPPDVPDQFRVTPGLGRISAEWVAPVLIGSSPVTSFDLRYRDLPSGAWTILSTPVDEPAITIANLSSSFDYELNVRSVSAAGAGVWSTSRTATPFPLPAAPGPPAGLTATSGINSITLNWGEPEFLGAEPGAFYELRGRVAGGSWNSFPVVAPTRTFTLENIDSDAAHEWQVRTVDEGGGTSAWSALVSATRAIAPQTPISIQANRSDGAVQLSWERGVGGGAPDYYTVRARPLGAVNWLVTSTTILKTMNVAALSNGTTYEFTVQATSGGLHSPQSAVVQAIPAGLPGAPVSLVLDARDGALDATWSPPTNTGGLTFAYELRFKTSAGSTWSPVQQLASPGASLDGLTNGESYDVAVRAVNAVGAGDWTSATGVPATVPGVPGDFAAVGDVEEISTSWLAPTSNGGSPITGYELRHRQNPDGDWSTESTGADQFGLTFTGFSPGVTHEFQVRAVNGEGAGAWSSVAAAAALPAIDLPGIPTGLTATGALDSIDLSWSAPAVGPGENPILSYELRTREPGGAWSTGLRTVTAPTVNLTVGGYTDERPREWAVRSVNADGHSAWSAAATASALIAPGTPTALSAARADGSVALSWTPASAGGAATGFTVKGRVLGSPSWTISQSVTAPTTTTTVGGLTNGVSYEFAVQAEKGALSSPLSSAITAVPAGLPAAPQALTLQPANAALSASWQAPTETGGLPVTYELRHKVSATSDWSPLQPVSGTSTSIAALTNGAVYDVSVRAVNEVGASGWSSTISGSPSTTPGPPQALTLTEGDTLVNATWSPPASNGGVAVSGYEVRHRLNGGAWGAPVAAGNASYSFISLVNGASYEFAVRAVNARGVGEWVSDTATPFDAGSVAPGSPSAIAAEVSTIDEAVALKWTAPSTGGTVETYEMRTCRDDSPSTCSPSQVVAAPALGVEVTNALTGAWLRASVRAVNTGGTSNWVTSSAFFSPDLTLPVMRIETGGRTPITSKEIYLPATYTLSANGSAAVASVNTPAVTEIRGRGNSTWSAPKKPYRIKLEKSTALLTGVTKSRHWALLANYYDPSALRTSIAMQLGSQTSLAWTPASRFVEVVLNGQYVGLYQLIETVRVDPARVNIQALKPDEPADLIEPNVTGGYMFEIDGRLDGPVTNTFTTARQADIVIQDPENAAAEQKNYLRDYLGSFEAALYGSGFTDPVTGWRAYMDEASLIDWYLVNEFLINNDAMYSSTDLYKPRGGKIRWGPLWDFDQSIGRGWFDHPPDTWWVRTGGLGVTTMAPWFTRLFQDPTFLSNVKARWQALVPIFAAAAGYAGTTAPGISTAAAQSESIWPKMSLEMQGAETSFAAATPVVQAWLQQRFTWMNSPAQYGAN